MRLVGRYAYLPLKTVLGCTYLSLKTVLDCTTTSVFIETSSLGELTTKTKEPPLLMRPVYTLSEANAVLQGHGEKYRDMEVRDTE